jgi:hypothetical protein
MGANLGLVAQVGANLGLVEWVGANLGLGGRVGANHGLVEWVWQTWASMGACGQTSARSRYAGSLDALQAEAR